MTLQETITAANMKRGGRYTIFHLGHDFGFPMAEKITFEGLELTKYAQYNDAARLFYTPYRKRKVYYQYFYNESFIICEGWHDLKDTDTKEVLHDDGRSRMTKSKYMCFDARYIEDAKRYLPDIIAVYENYKTGVDGRLYA